MFAKYNLIESLENHHQTFPPGATQLVDFVEAAGLADTLSGEGPFTVVAPTNDAFAKVSFTVVALLLLLLLFLLLARALLCCCCCPLCRGVLFIKVH